jgi:hypothetical protein
MKLTTSDQVLKQRLDDEVILLDLASGRYFGLPDVGARAWDRLVETGDTDAVFATLLAEYAVDEPTLREDLDELWRGLIEAGLVSVAPEA